MGADVRFLIEFNSNGEPVIRSITDGFDKLTPKANKGAAETEKFGGAMNKLGSVASVAIGVFGDLGGRVGLLTDALLNMTQHFGPVSGGFALLAVTVGLASREIEKAREQFRLLSEQELRALDSQQKGATIDQALRQRVQLLRAEDQELETLRQKFEQLRVGEERAGRDIARLNQVEALERNKILDARLIAAGKQQDAIVAEISALRLSTQFIGATGTALNDLALAQQLAAIEARRLAGEHGALLNILAEEAVVANRVKNTFDNFERGKAGVSQFEQIFGVSLSSSNASTAAALVDAFVPVFNQFGRDPRNAAAFQQAFQSLVTQVLATGAPDVEELLFSKFSPGAFRSLTSGLSSDLLSALESTRQAGQQWGASFEQDSVRVIRSLHDVGSALDQISRQLSALRTAALNIDVNFVASPPRPFGEFLPFMQQQFTSLNEIVESRTPTLDIPVQGLPQQIAGLYGSPGFGAAYTQYQALTRAIETEQNNFYAGFLGTSDGIGRANQAIASRRLAGFQDQLDTLLITAGSDAYGVARSSGGGGGGGGGAVTVNIDLRGATVTPASLDETIIPALERGIIRSTGQAPDFRVLN